MFCLVPKATSCQKKKINHFWHFTKNQLIWHKKSSAQETLRQKILRIFLQREAAETADLFIICMNQLITLNSLGEKSDDLIS